MSEAIQIELTDEEFAALRKYRDEDRPAMTREQVAQHLLRDHLIGLGVLPLGRANRGRGNWSLGGPLAPSLSAHDTSVRNGLAWDDQGLK